MRFRNNIILLIVLAALGGYVYYAERGKDDVRKAEDAKRKVLTFEAKEISEIKVVEEGLTVTGVRKDDKNWVITDPAGIEADSAEWETLASHIVGLEKDKVVSESATDLAPFGLAKPVVQLSVKRKDGQTLDVLIGEENPQKTLRYAKVSTAPEVFLSPNNLTNFKKSLTDLRNKVVIDMTPDNVDRFTIAEGAKKTTFRKSGDDWLLDAPTEGQADTSEVTGLLSDVQFARAVDFADTSVDAKKAGLDTPALQLTLHDTKAQADKVVSIGKEKEPGKFYAKDSARPAIFVIEKGLPEKLRRPVSAWRDKTIAKIDREKIDAIEVTRGAEKLALKKTGSDWNLADGRKAESGQLFSMLDVFEVERVKEIIDPPKAPATYGLDKPKLVAILRQEGKEVAKLTFGADSTQPEGIYLKKGESPSVLVVSKQVFDRFNVKADDIVEKPAPLPTTIGPGAPK